METVVTDLIRLDYGVVDLLNIPWHAFSQACNLNWRTADNVVTAEFGLESVEKRFFGAVNLMVARA